MGRLPALQGNPKFLFAPPSTMCVCVLLDIFFVDRNEILDENVQPLEVSASCQTKTHDLIGSGSRFRRSLSVNK